MTNAGVILGGYSKPTRFSPALLRLTFSKSKSIEIQNIQHHYHGDAENEPINDPKSEEPPSKLGGI
jgi:hypothetical protein